MRTAQAKGTTKSETVAWIALVVGLAYALVSAYWGAGGMWLLDTVGGVFERLGRSGSWTLVALLSFVVLLKVIAAVLPIMVIRSFGSLRTQRVLRLLTWVEAIVLTVYGLMYTSVGLLVQADVINASADSDRYAMAWHTY
ncbi:MAG: DUF3995 domain-containing protein, partial [Aeromicrobium sp.]